MTMTSASSDPTSLSGRHAVVTGGGSGIGAAIARDLARLGATLTLMGRGRPALEAVAADLEGSGHGVAAVDVTNHDGVASALAGAASERGPIAILVNNAGVAKSAPLIRTSMKLWREILAVNLDGTYNCIHAVLPAMLAAGWGRIVNVASTAGLSGGSYITAYCAAKHGVVGLTRALAIEVAARGVTVNAVCPGFTETAILADAVANIVAKTGRSEAEARHILASSNPQGRLVQPEEVARTVSWLCMPGSAAINGQAIRIDGGGSSA